MKTSAFRSSKKISQFLSGKQRKIFVLDTSVVVHDPKCFGNFGNNLVVIPVWLLEELDGLKRRERNGRSFIVREAMRELGKYLDTKDFNKEGYCFDHGEMLVVDVQGGDFSHIAYGMEENNDNRILAQAMSWKKCYPKKEVVLVSKDINLRAKAKAFGLIAEDYRSDKKIVSIRDLYTGFTEISIHPKVFSSLQGVPEINACIFDEDLVNGLFHNHCCRIVSGNSSNDAILAIFDKGSGSFLRVNQDFDPKGIGPKNDKQTLLYHLLTDKNIQVVTAEGKAGTGKTLMALAAGYSQLGTVYDQMIIFRPTHEIGQPLGFLPGDLGEKFSPWEGPVIDALKLIIPEVCGNGKKRKDNASATNALMQAMALRNISIGPINYIRGATLRNAFIIVDEAQNFRPEDLRILGTRVGKAASVGNDNNMGSKIVFIGDTSQIDSSYLDPTSCGITAVIEAWKGQKEFGHIILSKGERSDLAEKFARLM